MTKKLGNDQMPVVGFFPLFYNLAESGRAVLVAKRFVELGGHVVFFSHGGRYEKLAEDAGFRIVRCNPIYSDELVQHIVQVNRGEKKGVAYSESFIRESVESEKQAFLDEGVGMVVSFVNFTCSLSTRVLGIPFVNVSPAPGRFHLQMPDHFESVLTRWLPQFVKVPVMNWVFFHSKKFLQPFNMVAAEYGLTLFRSTFDVTDGDVTLGTNFLEFINVFPNQQMYPDRDYVGIISLEELFQKQQGSDQGDFLDEDVKNHLDQDPKSILLAMGSSGDKEFFIRLVKILDSTPYQIVVITANIVDLSELSFVGPHVLVKNFVPSIQKLHAAVDLSIIHGGQGTVYAAAYAGKPIIGFPMQFEQHLNLEKMVGHGVGLILSRHYFKDKDLLHAINQIFENYQKYVDSAQKLANLLPPAQGDRIAAKRLLQLIDEFNINKK
jgi:hypothetical protein